MSPPPYLDRHRGATALVVGAGPALATHLDAVRALIDRHECLVLGSNNVGAFLRPDYHAFSNRKGFATYAHTVDTSTSRVLVGAYVSEELIRSHYAGEFERIPYVNNHEAAFGIEDGVIQASCRTITCLLLGVALVMGARTLLVVGMDGYGLLAERGDRLYAYERDGYSDAQARLDVDYFRSLDRYQARFLDEIALHATAHGVVGPKILTPTMYRRHADDLERWLED